MADDFCKEFVKVQEKYRVEDRSHKHRNKPNRMSDKEVLLGTYTRFGLFVARQSHFM